MRFLCCDLGGTQADWGVFDSAENKFVHSKGLPTSPYDDFYIMMDEYLKLYDMELGSDAKKIVKATFGIAGPTKNKTVQPTNIPGWKINTLTIDDLLSEYGHTCSSTLINDFEALGYGIIALMDRGLESSDFERIHGVFKTAPPRPGEEVGTRSIVCGPGTGLGVACLVDGLMKDGLPFIFSSEGGHHTLAPESNQQLRILMTDGILDEKWSYESVLSHSGLRRVYNFFRKADHGASANGNITTPEIAKLAGELGDQAAQDAIQFFCEVLANFCGNIVLTFNCDKAVFLWGGALQSIPRDTLHSRFKRHYHQRCKHSDIVGNVPVVLLTNKEIPLLGCARYSASEVTSPKDKD